MLEIIDGPKPVPFADMARCMMDIVRMNGLFGGRRVTMIHVKRLLAALPADHLITVLDVGTGAGDIPREVVRWARREGRRIRVFALDRDAATLQIAGQVVRDYPEITFVRGDALSLPIRPGSIDLAISAMTLHHLEPAAGTRYFSEMDTAARMGFVVNDLVRSRIAHAVVWLITRFITRSAISRHDGPLSVRRSYTPREVSGLCEKAGVADVNVVHHWPYLRLCAVRDQRGRGGGRWRERASVSPATILDKEAGRAAVLWQRIDTFDAPGALVSSPTEVGATYTTSAECTTAIDGLERRRQSPQTVVMRDAQTMLTVMFRDKTQTITKSMSFVCAPDTVDSRGPKGTKRLPPSTPASARRSASPPGAAAGVGGNHGGVLRASDE